MQQRPRGRCGSHTFAQGVLLALVFFAATAPTLTWPQLTGGMENFNIETALEMARDGHWIVPTLDGQVRTRKPPLAEWITALGILSSRDLAWGARWPSLLCAALMLLAVQELGRLVAGPGVGLLAACICASTYLFLKFAREASYDTQLALWVTVANVGIAWALLRGRWWTGCAVAGIALGLALMTKGPPAILMTVVPPAVVVGWRELLLLWHGHPARAPRAGRPCHIANAAMPIFVGVILAAAIALPWTVYILKHFPGRLAEWYNEVSLATEAKFERRISVYFTYFAFVLWVLPWTIWVLAGIWQALTSQNSSADESENDGQRFALRLMAAWLLVPLIVMWFFPERRDRYVLPLLPPAAVLGAWALRNYVCRMRRGAASAPHWPLAVHWMIVAVIALGLPVVGAAGIKSFRTIDGAPWYPPAIAAGLGALAIVILLACLRLRRPNLASLAGGTFAIMLIVQAAFTYGYSRSPGGTNQSRLLIDAVRQRYPDAIFYNAINRPRRPDLPLELTIYLNEVVPRVKDPSTLTPGDRPKVIIFARGTAKAPPTFLPAAQPWYIKEEWWEAWVLPARTEFR